MKIAYISVVRNDEDIVQLNAIYYYNIGLRHFYFMLHLPTDELLQKVNELKMLLPGIELTVMRNDTDRHWHDEDCKKLTDKARADGIEYIVGTDADELLVLRKHKTIEELFVEYGHNDYFALYFKWYEYLTFESVYENAFIKIQYREEKYREQEKAIGRFNKEMFYVPGLHIIMSCAIADRIPPDVAYYAHFRDRNIDQYEQKYKIQYVNWLKRYGSFGLKDQMDADPNYLRNNWPRMMENRKSMNLVHDPINPELFKVPNGS